MKDRMTMLKIRLAIVVFLLKDFRKWVRWQKVGMTEEEKQRWDNFRSEIEKKYGYEVEVALFEKVE